MSKKKLLFIFMSFILVLLTFNVIIKKEEKNDIAQKRELTLMVPIENQIQKEWYQNQALEFMSINPDIDLSIRYINNNVYWDSMIKYYSEKDIPDMMIVDHTMLPAIKELGIIQNIDDYIQNNNVTQQIPHKILNTAWYDGKYYGLTYTCNTYALICNMSLLNKYNCSVPTNWDELIYNSIELLKEPADSFAVAGANEAELTNQFLQLLYANNGIIRNLKSDESIETYELLDKMVKERLISKDCVNWNRMDLIRKFVSREVAMIIVDSSTMPLFTQLSPNFPWIITSIPGESNKTSLFLTNNIVISTNANKDDAYKFFTFTLSKSQVEKRMETLGSLTIRNDVNNLFEQTQKSTEIFCDEFENANPIPTYSLWNDISLSVQNSVIDIFYQEKTPVQIAQSTYDLVNTYIIDSK